MNGDGILFLALIILQPSDISNSSTLGQDGGHLSNVHGVEDPCIEGCRFYPEEGEVSALEILEDYKDYQGYDEVRSKWEELDNQENEG
jgi:hypothetical protein